MLSAFERQPLVEVGDILLEQNPRLVFLPLKPLNDRYEFEQLLMGLKITALSEQPQRIDNSVPSEGNISA